MTFTQQLTMHEDFGSTFLGTSRNILVYTPPGYVVDTERRYPVLYMHDGQNLMRPEDAFGGVAWGVDSTAESLILAGSIEPLIIVGIYNTPSRLDEYTHVKATA